KIGARLFGNNCAVCHGADGGGNWGYPNLTDKDWIWGGTPEQIKTTLVNGRKAAMPAWGGILGEQGINSVTEYLLQLNEREHDVQAASVGAKLFAQNCAACHGPSAQGNPLLGAPILTNNIWLYGG